MFVLALAGAAAAQDAAGGQVTFARDVAPILQRSCQNCHRDGSIAPMALLTYEQARPWARSIKEKVTTRKMPPWFIDKNIGVQGFKEDKSLTDAEIATIVRWVDGGAPRGNPADMPPPMDFSMNFDWQIGEPDLIVPIPEPYVVEPEAPDWFGRLESPSGLTEDRWIKAVETKPSADGFAVTHHAVTNLVDPDGERSFLNEYAIGKNGDIFPDGTGREMKAGSTILFNMHYHAIGERRADRTSVGLTFYPRGTEPQRNCSREASAGTWTWTSRRATATSATTAIIISSRTSRSPVSSRTCTTSGSGSASRPSCPTTAWRC